MFPSKSYLYCVLYVDESHHLQCLSHLVSPLPDDVEGGGGDGLGGDGARTVTTVDTSLQQTTHPMMSVVTVN